MVIAHILGVFVEDDSGYVLDVNYAQLISAIKLERRNGDTVDIIQPTPWLNAPKPDGSTVEFKSKVKRCQDYLHRFAMHTPEYFLTFSKQRPHPPSNHKRSTRNKHAQPTSTKRRQNNRGKDLDEDYSTDESIDVRGEAQYEDDYESEEDYEGEDEDEGEGKDATKGQDEDEGEDEDATKEQSTAGGGGEGRDDGQCKAHFRMQSTLTLPDWLGQQRKKRKRGSERMIEGTDWDLSDKDEG